MSKVRIQAPTSSNNSATSSENSETQSVEEHPTIVTETNRSAALIRAKTSWRRMKDLAAEKEKENEAKRPPWRAVSVSTLAKPDKNALLRAKLLDASRRLRAGKASVALQTDFVPTKLLKEASIGPQYDLILYKDVGILTDGQYSIKKDVHQQYILTYSISQMTDSIGTSDVATQTLLPKVYKDNVTNSYSVDLNNYDNDEIYHVERRVQDQLKKIRYLDLYGEDQDNAVVESTAEQQGIKLNPTSASWHFEDDVIEMDDAQHFIPYTIEPFKPWISFIPFPFRLSGNTLIGRQKIDWYALLQSIDDLIRESNNLVDKLEGMIQDRIARRQNVLRTTNDIKKFEPSSFVFPSEHWLPIIEKQEMELQSLIDSK
ncbi:uncharacterized protein LOC133839634 [Drosophila sulfurigaster albostrigata]|uniref:uncharacterized protein LOC133839634 n=1 Tax=Drosophila sulfurigaster albostrigata TaxID=89887 RepID=UPI002D21BA68|nr:uncharacterized protein LOC133839634 [Drosophila sulfurigaster albostrigata]